MAVVLACVLVGFDCPAGWALRADGLISFERAGQQVWVMRPNGTYPVLLLDDALEGVAWSPVGMPIAFARSDGVWVAGSDLRGEHLVIPGGDMPAWTPDGRLAYVFSGRAGSQLAVADADGTHVRVLTRPGQFAVLRDPLVLSTGRIVITGTRAPGQVASQWIVNRTGRRIHRLKAPRGLGGNPVLVVSAAPHGHRVMLHDKDGEQDIWEEGTLRGTTVAVNPAWRFSTFSLGGAVWSPRGDAILTQVATASNADDPYQPTESQLAVYNPAIAPPQGRTMLGSPSADTTFGFGWEPQCTILRGGSDITIHGRRRQDRICVTGSHDVIEAGRGDDVIYVWGSHNIVRGQAGRDVIVVHGQGNRIYGGSGSDLINTRDHASRPNTINGGAGNNLCIPDRDDHLRNCHR